MKLQPAIDRDSPLPLYAQVKRRLQAAILAWPADSDRFHTDQRLCEMFGVSRATVRQALAELEEAGLLTRKQGFGTLVNRRKIEESFNAQASFTDQWAKSGRSLAVRLLRFDRLPCPAPFAEMLDVAVGTEVVYLERLRLSGSMRIVWDRRYIPAAVAAGIPRREFGKVSLLDVLGRRFVIERGETQIEAALAGEEYAEVLEILAHDPVLIRTLSYFSAGDLPVMAGVSVYRADQVRYKLSVPLRMRGVDANDEVRIPAFAT